MISFLATSALPSFAAAAARTDQELDHGWIEKSMVFFILAKDLSADIQ
jgi:hypothetical protein